MLKVSNSVGVSKLQRKRSKTKGFPCSYPGCGLSYSRQWKLDRHLCSHTGERPFRCETSGCEKTYQSKSHLLRHVRSVHVSSAVVLPCLFESCKQIFKDKWALIKHIKNHGRSKQFPCSICSKSFISAKKLTSHELEHQGVLPFSCQICKSQWANPTLLRRHLKIHDALQCEYQSCMTVLHSHKALRKHLAQEHRTTYTCEHCTKSFNNKGILRDHVLVHLTRNERGLLRCPHPPCNRVYLQKRNLTHHIKVFHNTTRFYCQVKKCNKSCISEVLLQRHCERKHKTLGEKFKENIIDKLATIAPVVTNEDLNDQQQQQPEFYEVRVISRDHL